MRTIFACLLLCSMIVGTASAADVSGKWSGTFTPEGGNEGSSFAVLKQSGTVLTGTAGPNAENQWPIESGKVTGDKVSLVAKSTSDGTVYKCDLVLAADHLKGDITATRADGQTLKAKLDLTRVK